MFMWTSDELLLKFISVCSSGLFGRRPLYPTDTTHTLYEENDFFITVWPILTFNKLFLKSEGLMSGLPYLLFSFFWQLLLCFIRFPHTTLFLPSALFFLPLQCSLVSHPPITPPPRCESIYNVKHVHSKVVLSHLLPFILPPNSMATVTDPCGCGCVCFCVCQRMPDKSIRGPIVPTYARGI